MIVDCNSAMAALTPIGPAPTPTAAVGFGRDDWAGKPGRLAVYFSSGYFTTFQALRRAKSLGDRVRKALRVRSRRRTAGRPKTSFRRGWSAERWRSPRHRESVVRSPTQRKALNLGAGLSFAVAGRQRQTVPQHQRRCLVGEAEAFAIEGIELVLRHLNRGDDLGLGVLG